jgi:hypothetical protein
LTASEQISAIKEKIFNIRSAEAFNEIALEIFRYQHEMNPIFHEYTGHLGINQDWIEKYEDIPFLPISFFKDHKIVSGNAEEEEIFYSSGTSGMKPSSHYVLDLALYKESFMKGFTSFYGDPGKYRILGLLPSYLERKGSSLVFMVNEMIKSGGHKESGFFLSDFDQLSVVLKDLSLTAKKTLLIGVSFALVDFAESHGSPLNENIIIMETGGMKGRREEITRQALHQKLCDALSIKEIHSEYGMTELLTQAYSKGDGRFRCPPWMKVIIRDIQDPFHFLPPGESGAINIIDLANIHSCAFIETQDIGRMHPDGSFEVLGRSDASDIRGCSLMIG